MMATRDKPDFRERHYTVPELAKIWRMAPNTIRSWFAGRDDVITFGTGKLTKSRRRTYLSIRIPESVASRVYRQHTGKDL